MRGTTRATGGTVGTVLLAGLLAALAAGCERLTFPALGAGSVAATAWWPAAGVVVAALAYSRRGRWPLILATAALASAAGDLLCGLGITAAVPLAAANLVGPTLAAGLLTGWRVRTPLTVTTFGSGLRLVAALSVGVGASTTAALPYLALTSDAWPSDARSFLLVHAFVTAAFAPLLLFPSGRELWDRTRRAEVNLEWAVQLAGSVVVAALIFVPEHDSAYGFVLFLPLLWGAARLGPVRAMTSLLVTAGIALGATRHVDAFAPGSATHRQLIVLLCLLAALAVAVLLMLLSARAQRLATERAREREDSLAESQRLVRLGSWTWDVATGEVRWSAQMYEVFGLDPRRFRPSLLNWLEQVHPDDRVLIQRVLLHAAKYGEPWEADFRLLRDGEQRWIYSRGSAARDAAGAICELRGTSQDVTAAHEAAQQLTDARDLYQGVLSAVSEQAIIGTDPSGLVTVFNAGAEKMLGYRAEEIVGEDPLILHDPDEIAARAAELGMPPTVAVLAAGVKRDQPQTRQWTYVARDGRRIQVMLTVTQIRDGKLVGYLGVATDVTAQLRAEAALRESEERFRLAFDSASVGMYMASLDPARHAEIRQVNAAMCDFLGRTSDEIVGRTPDAFSDDAIAAEDEAREFANSGGDLSRWRREVRFRHSDGSEVWGLMSCSVVLPQNETPYVIALVEDITARKLAEERLRHLALHDALTGLPNRLLLIDRIQHALAASARSGIRLGLLFVDLDGFKQVNDSAGHPAGDELLAQAASRLEAAIRPGDTVARLGGDEFAILCPDLASDADVAAIADRCLAALRTPFGLEAGTFTISASVGACVSGQDIDSAEEFLHRSDTAMYSAKRSGKDRFMMASADEQARAARDTRLRPALETALSGDELIMYGQPIVDLRTGAVTGVETLLRWQHPERGILTPGEFLDVAENSPLMVPIGRRVLVESCRMAASWDRLGPAAPDVHVNVSGRQLTSGTFAQDVLDALERTGLSPERLVLELTETHMPLMADSLRTDMIRLREFGVRLAIDDIGTGYSSLARITELPVDVLKIDMKFIRDLGSDPRCDAVVRAVLEIGRALHVDVVAEGVETDAQQAMLRSYGCRLVQGFLLARPQPEAALALTLDAAAAQRTGPTRPGGRAERTVTSVRR